MRAGARGHGGERVNPLAARDEQLHGGVEVRPFSVDIPTVVALLYPPYQTQTRLVSVFAEFARQIIRQEVEGLKRP